MQQNISLKIRKATMDDAPSIAAISVKSWQESYKGMIDQDVLDGLSVEHRLAVRLKFFVESSPESPKCNFVACFGDKIIGFCDAGPSRKALVKGEIYAIYVLNAFKGKGMGYELFSAASTFLTDEGLFPFIAWTLEENKPARDFYERQGGKICETGTRPMDGKAYSEVCYLFD